MFAHAFGRRLTPFVVVSACLWVGSAAWPGTSFAGAPVVSECRFAGIYPTVLAPFRDCSGDCSGIDTASLKQQIQFELHGGVQGLLVLGTIGEGQYATMEERADVIRTAVEVAGGCVPVVAGIHTCDLEMAKQQMLQAKEFGASAVLVKYAGRPKAPASEVLGFFAVLSEMHALPIFYYHYPSQTGLKLSADDVVQILELPGVVGIKESTLNLREVQAHICRMRGQGKVFLSGSALNLTQFLDLGGQGAMCPEAVLLPGPTVTAYLAYTQCRKQEARAIQSKLFVMSPILRDRPTPAAVNRALLMTAEDHKAPIPMGHDQPQARLKAALNCLGVATPTCVKCPLPHLTPKEERAVKKTVCRLQAIDWSEIYLCTPAIPTSAGSGQEGPGGMLLKTGAFQLGPNVGKDLLRSQGDGKSGF